MATLLLIVRSDFETFVQSEACVPRLIALAKVLAERKPTSELELKTLVSMMRALRICLQSSAVHEHVLQHFAPKVKMTGGHCLPRVTPTALLRLTTCCTVQGADLAADRLVPRVAAGGGPSALPASGGRAAGLRGRQRGRRRRRRVQRRGGRRSRFSLLASCLRPHSSAPSVRTDTCHLLPPQVGAEPLLLLLEQSWSAGGLLSQEPIGFNRVERTASSAGADSRRAAR